MVRYGDTTQRASFDMNPSLKQAEPAEKLRRDRALGTVVFVEGKSSPGSKNRQIQVRDLLKLSQLCDLYVYHVHFSDIDFSG